MSKGINTKYTLTDLPSFFPSPANTIFPLTDVESVTDVPSSSGVTLAMTGASFSVENTKGCIFLEKSYCFL